MKTAASRFSVDRKGFENEGADCCVFKDLGHTEDGKRAFSDSVVYTQT